VIEKVASMVDQVKDLQQKVDEAKNNICRLKYQFMGEKANRRLQQKDNKEEIDTHHSQEVQEAQNRK
jgi:hypothetical protein